MPEGNATSFPSFAIPAAISREDKIVRAARRIAIEAEKGKLAPSVIARTSSFNKGINEDKKIDEDFLKSKLREFNRKWGVGPAAANAKSNNPASIQKICSRKRPYPHPLHLDNDGFAVPAPVKNEEGSEKPPKRQAVGITQPISVRTGRPLSSSTVDYAKMMREIIEKSNREKRDRIKVESINKRWQDGLAKANGRKECIS